MDPGHGGAGVREADIEGILEAAVEAAGDHEGALAWVDGPLRRYLAAGRSPGCLPPALSRDVGAGDGPFPDHAWPSLAGALASAVASRPGWSPRRTRGIAVEAAIGHADLVARREANARRLSGRDMAEARSATARVSWLDHGSGTVVARFRLGRLGFQVLFTSRGERCERHWLPEPGTGRALSEMGARVHGAPDGRPTGVFPAIDAALRAITREYLDRYNPSVLEIHGANGKRNAHNAATYGGVMPEEYRLVPVVEPGSCRASADGVVAVRFERLPEAAPPFPVPLEAGVEHGDGGRPLPDTSEARRRAIAEAGVPGHPSGFR